MNQISIKVIIKLTPYLTRMGRKNVNENNMTPGISYSMSTQ